MAVTEQTPINSSTGNGVTTVFPYTFKIIADADLEVSVDGVVQTLNADYTVSDAGEDAGGNVTFATAPADGATVVRRRNMAFTRSADYQYQGDLPNDVLNEDQDAPVLMIQQLKEQVDRSIKAPLGDSISVLPDAANRANAFLAFDADGNPIASTGTGADAGLRGDLAADDGADLVGFIQAGTGATARSAQDALRDFVSVLGFVQRGQVNGVTSNQNGIANAVAHCYTNGLDLYWPHPGAAYVSTATIPNFHSVRHFGPGRILRGSDTFYVEPKESQANVIYVTTTGSDTNDGLSSSQAFLTIQAAVNVLAKYRPLNGSWTVDIGAGTYLEAVALPAWLNANEDYLEIRGPAQATVQTVPTAIIKYPGSGIVGMDLSSGNKVKVMDLKFANWKGAAITGLNIDDHGILWAVNVHGIANRQSIVNNGSRVYIQGGILSGYPTTDADAALSGLAKWTTGAFPAGGGSVGVMTYAGGVTTIGYNSTSLADGTIIETMGQAGYEGKAFTHCVSAYTTFRSNELATWVYSNARFDERANEYKKNQLVHKLQKGFLSKDLSLPSNYNLAATYAQAPATAGDGNFEFYRFLQNSSEDATLFGAAPIGGLDICHQRTSTLQTGTIAATLTRNLCTIKAGMLSNSPNGKYVEVYLCGECTGAAGTKTIQLLLGSTVLATFVVASGAQTWTARAEVWASSSTSQVVIASAMNATPATTRNTKVTTMTTDQTLDVWQTIPGAADTATIHEARVVFWG